MYVKNAMGRGGGVGKEGTLLLLLIAATVAIATISVGKSRDDPTMPVALLALLSSPTQQRRPPRIPLFAPLVRRFPIPQQTLRLRL